MSLFGESYNGTDAAVCVVFLSEKEYGVAKLTGHFVGGMNDGNVCELSERRGHWNFVDPKTGIESEHYKLLCQDGDHLLYVVDPGGMTWPERSWKWDWQGKPMPPAHQIEATVKREKARMVMELKALVRNGVAEDWEWYVDDSESTDERIRLRSGARYMGEAKE